MPDSLETVASQDILKPEECNYVDLGFEHDWENDKIYQMIVTGIAADYPPLDEVTIEYAKAIFVFGRDRYREAFKKFCPDAPRDVAKALWNDFGAKELCRYFTHIRNNGQNQSIQRPITFVPDFMPGHDFLEDPCYKLCTTGVADWMIEVAKVYSLGGALHGAVRQVFPSIGQNDDLVNRESDKWRRNLRARALHQSLSMLVKVHAVSEGPKDGDWYLDELEKMFATTLDVDARIKLMKAIMPFKEIGVGIAAGGGGMPADFDTSGLEGD